MVNSNPPKELTHAKRLMLWRQQQAREKPWRGSIGPLGILDFLSEGGRYRVGVDGARLQIVRKSIDGRWIVFTPFALRPELLTPDSAADLGNLFDVFLAFYGCLDQKIRSYLLSLRLPRDLFWESEHWDESIHVRAEVTEREWWSEAQMGLLGCLHHPAPWSLEFTPYRRRAYVRQSVLNRMIKFRTDRRKERKKLISRDAPAAAPAVERQEAHAAMEADKKKESLRLEVVVAARRRKWIMRQEGLNDRDLRLLDLIFRGYTEVQACREVDGPGFSPINALKQKLARRKPPKKKS